MADTETELRDIVDTFIAQLKRVIRRSTLETVQSALGDEASPRQRGRKKSAKAPRATAGRRKGGKRSPEQLEALVKSLLAYVKKNPGQRIEQIGAALGTATKELALPAKKLIGEKQLRTKGQKRATAYFAK